MDSREHSEIPPAPSYPSPNAAQIAQGTVNYFANQRHLTEEELHLSAELTREVAGANANMNVDEGDGAVGPGTNGMAHGQAMVLGQTSPGHGDVNRRVSLDHQTQGQAQQHQHPQHHHQQQQQQRQQQQQHQQHQQQQQHHQQPPQHQGQQRDHQLPQPGQQGQQHLLHFSPSQQAGMDPNHDLSYGDQSARRKRSKVSRACDECRRKKVRCDATSEAGVETCSNCRRTNSTCEFSRVPMKRGPSKGYIKELADRIISLETQMQPGMQQQPDLQYPPMNEDGSSARGYQEFSPPMDNQGLTKKRTLSMSDGLQNAFMQPPFIQNARPTSVGGWPVQAPTKDSTHANDLATFEEYSSPNNAPTSSKLVAPFWAQEGADAPQQPEITPEQLETMPTPIEIDDKILEAYYNHIHPIFPILPTSRERLFSLLRAADRLYQEAFLHAICVVTGADVLRIEKELHHLPTFEKAQDYLAGTFRDDPRSRPPSVNFVLLQTFIFMVLDSDSRGPENLRGENGIAKTVLVEGAFILAHHLAKSFNQIENCDPQDKDVDSDGNLARKNWTVLMILSRWHSLSVASRDLFGINEAAMPEDRGLFGSAALQLARYSSSISEINEIIFDSSVHPSSGRMNNHAVRRLFQGQLKRLKDLESWHDTTNDVDMDLLYTNAVCPLVFWSLTLLLKRHLYTSVPAEIIYPAEVIIDLLGQQSESDSFISSPIHFHALALAIMTLLETTDLPELSADAWIALEKALRIISQREKYVETAGEFGSIFANKAWEACFRNVIEQKLSKLRSQPSDSQQLAGAPLVGPTEQRSLEHLADLAVGAGGAAANAEHQQSSTGGAGPEDKDASLASPPAAAGTSGSANTANPLLELIPGSGVNVGSQKARPDLRIYVDFTQLTRRGYLTVFAGA